MNGKVGDIVVPDKGYAYAATTRDYANEYNSGVILSIRTPKGARISRAGDEAVFPRNAKYKILSKNKTPGGEWRIELEYILPD